ncbi:hypothetical protein TrVFT333_005330 [Trichoderma virens FT-333]|nr:hypothetical protein TrVFT333_005330 [Trichoderma virens FT-333]
MSAAIASLAVSNPTSGSYGVAEFYITCNPPLLPLGVKRIIESAQSACQDKLLEILYEPETPWFKCITATEYQNQVSDVIQNLMHKLLKKEVQPLKFNVVEDIDVHEGTFHPDVVSRETDEPLIIPWMVYNSIGSDMYPDFDHYRFPEIMAKIPFKTVWRGLQNSTGVSIETLLSIFSRVSKSETAPTSIADFAFYTNCEMSHNLREDLIYIGSWESMELVDRAVRRLQAILNLLASKPKVASHLILLEGSAATKLTYRWMSHVGLVHATFAVQSGSLDIAEEYKYLANAVVIRTHIRERSGRWITDDTVYPLKDTRQHEAEQIFSAFKGYLLPSKPKNAKVQVLHDWKYATGQRDTSPTKTRVTDSLCGPMRNNQNVPSNLVADDNMKLSYSALVNNDQELAPSQELHDDQKLFACQPSPASARLSPALHGVDTIVQSTQRLATTERDFPHASGPSIAGGSVSILNEEPRSKVQSLSATSDYSQGDLLISLNEADEEAACENGPAGSVVRSTIADLQEVNEDIIRLEQFERSDDLIWLKDESPVQQPPPRSGSLNVLDDVSDYPSLQNYETLRTEAEKSTTVTENNPLEAQEHDLVRFLTGGLPRCGLIDAQEHILMSVPDEAQDNQIGNHTGDLVEFPDTQESDATDNHAGDLVEFGLAEERPREFFQTMNQRGGRGIAKLSKSARSPGRISSDADQGPATGSQSARWNSSTPTGPRANAHFEADFPALGGTSKSPKKQAKQPLRYADAAKLSNGPSKRPPQFPISSESTSRPHQISSKASVASSAKVVESSKEPKLEEYEKGSHVPLEKSDILRDAKTQLRKMSQILELTSGYVSLEVVFGRIYIKHMGPSHVNHTGSGPAFAVKEVVDLLNGENFRQDHIGFSPMLSTSEGDANMLVSIMPPGETPWHLFEKETWYDFHCTYFGPRGEEAIIIELNADKLQYRVRGPRHEVFAIHLHCPQRAWDMKARAVRSQALEPEYPLKCYIESLIEEMDILVDHRGDVTIKYPDYNGTRELEAIVMRRVARYHHGKKRDSSVLTVTMTYSMEESLVGGKRRAGAVRVFACPTTSLNSALPHKYFEASLTSSRLGHHFDQNVNLEYGDKTTWDTDQLASENVFEDMLRPAFGMISHMDHIGSSNNTMRGVTDEDAFHESLVEVDVKKKKWAFW